MMKRDISLIIENVRKYLETNEVHDEILCEALEEKTEKPAKRLLKVPFFAEMCPRSEAVEAGGASKRSLDDLVKNVGESFQSMLLRLISEKGLTNAEAYTRANMTKQTFFKIKNNPDYHPQKKTALALTIALGLNLDEAKDLLNAAGYSFSRSSKMDIIVQYFIENADYDIYTVDMVLEEFGEDTLTNYASF